MDSTFAIVHNIPTPYRDHLFRLLRLELQQRGWAFHVHFMARTIEGRPSEWGDSSLRDYPHTFWPSHSVRFRHGRSQFNPRMLMHLHQSPPDILMVGGPWASITGIAASWWNSAHRSLGWFEGNTKAIGTDTALASAFKKAVLRRFDACVVPGEEGVRMIRFIYGPERQPPVLFLPNVIDDSMFSPCDRTWDRAEAKRSLSVESGVRLAIWPARLIPAKGVCEFLELLTPEVLHNWRILILGEGPLRSEVDRVVADRRLGAHVTLLPPQSYNTMPNYYRAADLFLLPSLQDPNPLSVVEAIHSGLPLLVSKRIGNYDEAVLEGANAWSFDPIGDAAEMAVVEAAFSASANELNRRGEESARIAKEKWNSQEVVANFVRRATAIC